MAGAPSASGTMLMALFTSGDMTRAQATLVSGVSRSAAGNAISELEALGLVRALPPGSVTTQGRPSPRIEIAEDGVAALAVQIEPDCFVLSVVNLAGRVTFQLNNPLPVLELTPRETIERVAAVLRESIATSSTRIAGVGVSVPGIVGLGGQVVRAAFPIGWRDIEVGPMLRNALGTDIHIAVEHDATIGALGEYRRGSEADARRFLYLTAQQQGLGAAMITAANATTLAVELHGLQAGHLSIRPDGRQCTCGARGCLERYVSGDSIRAAIGVAEDASERAVSAAIEGASGDAFARSEVMESLQLGLVALVNVLVPDRIVLSDVLRPIAARYPAELRSALNRSVIAQVQDVEILGARVEDPIAVGAAELAFGALFADPSEVIRSIAA